MKVEIFQSGNKWNEAQNYDIIGTKIIFQSGLIFAYQTVTQISLSVTKVFAYQTVTQISLSVTKVFAYQTVTQIFVQKTPRCSARGIRFRMVENCYCNISFSSSLSRGLFSPLLHAGLIVSRNFCISFISQRHRQDVL